MSRLRVFTAAVIGSMVPDFGLLWPRPVERLETHSLYGLLTFCLPVGLITYALTQWLIKPAMREALPDRAYARLPVSDDAPPASWPHWVLIVLAILFGALTHLSWDLFTHEDSRGTRWFPVLGENAPEMAGHTLRITRWLQYGSSGLGLLTVIVGFALWWWHTQRVQAPLARRLASPERIAWLSCYLFVPLAVIAVDCLRGLPRGELGTFLRLIAIDGMRWSVVALLLVSVLLRLRLVANAR